MGNELSKGVVAIFSTDVGIVILVLVCGIVVIEAVIVDGLALEEEVSNRDALSSMDDVIVITSSDDVDDIMK